MSGHEDSDIAVTKASLLGIHRYLYPEDHEGYWRTQPQSDWPHGWGGPGDVFEWSAETIEVVAQEVELLMEDLGMPLRED